MPTLFIITLMAVVTAIPRLMPAFIIERVKFPTWIGRWLEVIPYAALGALIFPGILTVVPERPYIGLVGGVAAIILALFRVHIVLVVLGASVVVYFVL
ncbi:AzlD domain-containing protein [Amphibacillus cookii]|uniref:AzlD domain-containing protein n=1 Tax=Amphibacillus cookii TaxID=767787 RepID=UPI00195E5095|nr:AzlD domain-containing protein [Amphibacillus cookii]MBM7540080.1 branched-subunit amino acid transport protein [Amphibacillus cookii]